MYCLRRAAFRVLSSSRSTQTRSLTSLKPFAPRRSLPSTTNPSILQRRWLADDSSDSTAAESTSSEQPPKDEEQAEEAILTSENPTETKAPEPSTPVEAVVDTAKAATQSAVDTAKRAAPSAADQAGTSYRQAAFEAQENAPVPTVYVGNLFFDVTADALGAKFAEAGSIKETKVMRDGRGLSKGFGYVEFEDAEAASRAIELFNLQSYEGRRISVQFSRPRPQRSEQGEYAGYRGPKGARNSPSRTLFFGNMSFDMSDRDLNALFRSVKNVVDVRVAIDRRTGQPRGFAHADFTDVESAESAMEAMQGKVIGGRALRIDFSTSSGRANLGGMKGALGESSE